MANLMQLFLTAMTINAVFSQKYDEVQCNFEIDVCAWSQGNHDLSNWTRQSDSANSYISAKVNAGSSQTLARMYSGNFSYPDSPSISLRYYINGNSTEKYNTTNIKVYRMGQSETLKMIDEVEYEGQAEWKIREFTVPRADDGQASNGPIIIEADLKSAFDEVAVDDITVFGCRITPGSVNSAVDPFTNGLSCLSVPETSAIGKTACSFRTSGVSTATFAGGILSNYNDLALTNSNTEMDLNMKRSYSDIVDTPDPNVVPEGTITCVDSTNGNITTFTIIIKIFEENNYAPTFLAPSYAYIIPQTQDIDEDITINGPSPKIIATDVDNSEDSAEDSSNKIIFQLENDFGTFMVNSTLINANYPRQYNAEIHLLKPPDYAQSPYALTLIAMNAAGNLTSRTDVTVSISQRQQNTHFSFASTYYTAIITEEMLRYSDTYEVPISHPIAMEEEGMNIPLSYTINYNCAHAGDEEECQILRENFRIDPKSGVLYFTNYVRNWNHSSAEVTFEILASQDEFPHKTTHTSVTVSFELPS